MARKIQLVKCVKCGRIYDYEKYNGICPECCRYNRPGTMGSDAELHDKYDSYSPHTLNSDARTHAKNGDDHYFGTSDAEVHRKNGDTHQGQKTASSSKGSYAATKKQTKTTGGKLSRPIVIGVVVLICFMVFGTLFSAIDTRFSGDLFGDDTFWTDDGDDTTWLEDTDDGTGEWTEVEDDGVYIDGVCGYWLGDDLSDVDWVDGYSIYLEDYGVEKADLEDMTAPEGYTYVLYDLTYYAAGSSKLDIDSASVSFYLDGVDGEEMEIVQRFTYGGVISDFDYGLDEYLVLVPDDIEGESLEVRAVLWDKSTDSSTECSYWMDGLY